MDQIPARSSPSTPTPTRDVPIAHYASSATSPSAPLIIRPARAQHGTSESTDAESFLLRQRGPAIPDWRSSTYGSRRAQGKGYSETDRHPEAPRNYADARVHYKIVLEVLARSCAERRRPSGPAEADEEGAHFENGKVTYAAATLDAIAGARQADSSGDATARYGGLNLPGRSTDDGDEIRSPRAESGLMTVFGCRRSPP